MTSEADFSDAPRQRDAAVDNGLRDEILGVLDAMQADPGRAIPGDQAFATIRARHSDRLKKSGVNIVTVPGHPGDDVPAGRLKSIQRAAELEKKQ